MGGAWAVGVVLLVSCEAYVCMSMLFVCASVNVCVCACHSIRAGDEICHLYFIFAIQSTPNGTSIQSFADADVCVNVKFVS